MKKWIRLVIVAVALSPCLLLAQDFSGTWQGILQVPRGPLRIVMKISKGDRDAVTAVMYSIDEGSGGNAASSASVQNRDVKLVFTGIRATFDGKLNATGNSIAGTWSQGQPLPLTLNRATPETAWAIPESTSPLAPMAANADPAFEVATIRPSPPDDVRLPTIQTQTRRWSAINRTVLELLTYSYALHHGQILNAPGWLDERYDITAQPNGEGQPTQQQWKVMVKKLLADRFKLSTHLEKRDISVYALTVKTAPQLSPSTGNPAGPPNLATRAQGRFAARNATMGDLAGELGFVLERPVVDRTGISGRFDFTLFWTPDEFQIARLRGFPAPARGNGEPPNLFTAIQEQLGLTLETARMPADVLVIDHIERPSEN